MPGELEKVDAPISGEVLPAKQPLTQQQIQAVMYDAADVKRDDIAAAVGVSPSTIKGWRAKPEYQEELARVKQMQGDAIAKPVKQLHKDIIDGATEAVAALRDALTAVDRNGKPAYIIRNDAAKELLKRGYELSSSEASGLGPGGGGGTVNAKGATVIAIKIDQPSGD